MNHKTGSFQIVSKQPFQLFSGLVECGPGQWICR